MCERERGSLLVIQALCFLFLDSSQCYLVSSNRRWPGSVSQGTPGHPLASQSLHSPQWARLKMNSAWIREREGKGKGRGLWWRQRGAVNKMPIWEGKENTGTSSHSPCPPDNMVPIPLKMRTHTHTHTHGCMRTLLQKRLYILDEESWSSNCGEADQTVLHAFFPSFLFLCLRLFLGALSRIYNRPTFTFVKERLFQGCLKFSPMFLCLVAVFCFCWGFFVYGKCIFFGRGGGWRSDCA